MDVLTKANDYCASLMKREATKRAHMAEYKKYMATREAALDGEPRGRNSEEPDYRISKSDAERRKREEIAMYDQKRAILGMNKGKRGPGAMMTEKDYCAWLILREEARWSNMEDFRKYLLNRETALYDECAEYNDR